jgi:hypothetical protein
MDEKNTVTISMKRLEELFKAEARLEAIKDVYYSGKYSSDVDEICKAFLVLSLIRTSKRPHKETSDQMAWVSAHEGMRDHPKTRDLSRKLECSRHEAIGILVTLWLWGLNNADRDGNILAQLLRILLMELCTVDSPWDSP